MSTSSTPVVFINGLWLHASSWGPWLNLYREAGYDPIAPGWPGEPPTVAEARERPDLVANTSIDDAVSHFSEVVETLSSKPILIGHSFGGLLAEKMLGMDLAIAAVAIDPTQIKGVLPLPLAQLRSALPALGNPANLHKAISLTAKQFRFGFGNGLSEEESDALYEKWAIPAPARPFFQAAAANFAPHSQAKVDTANATRGPLLLVSGTKDHTVPDVSTRSTFKQYRHSDATTELKQFEGRGHSLTIDSGWSDVADVTLKWLDGVPDLEILGVGATGAGER
jgi:pimeloyl-ACP methyl ester carboxylesterase